MYMKEMLQGVSMYLHVTVGDCGLLLRVLPDFPGGENYIS